MEMASTFPLFSANKITPPLEKNYSSFFLEILYDSPASENTCA